MHHVCWIFMRGLSIPLVYLRTCGYDKTDVYVIKTLYKKRIHPLNIRSVWYLSAMKENFFILVFIDISFIFILFMFGFFFYLLIRRGFNLIARNYNFWIIIFDAYRFWKLTYLIKSTFNYHLILYSWIWFNT